MKRAIIYLRISSDRQIDNTSLDTQEKICRAYCDNEGYEVVELIKNEAVSAKETNVKRVAELLEFAKAKKDKFDVLVVFKLDRFARSQEQHHWLRGQLMKLSVILRSATERIDETPSGRLVEGVLAAVNEYDNAVRIERAKIGTWRRVDEGLWPWQPPTGYMRPKMPGVRLSVCVWDETCSQSIIDIFTLFSTGAYTQGQLASMMNKRKLRDYRNKTLKFSKQYINKVLNNRFYVGLLLTQDGKIIQGKHQPLITPSLWEKSQNVLHGKSNNTINKRLYDNPDFPLRRFTICSECNKPFTGSWAKGNGGRYAYYYCPNPNCINYAKMVSKIDLENKFCDYLKQIKPKEEFILLFEKVFTKRYEERAQEIKGEYLRKLDEVKRLEKELEWLIEKGSKGIIPDNLLQRKLEETEQKITLSKMGLTEIHAEELDIKALLDYAAGFIKTVDLVWYDSIYEAKTKYQRLVFPDGVLFNGKEFSNQRLGLPFKLINDIATKKSTDVRMRGLEPPRFLRHSHLKAACMPVSPHPRIISY